MTSVIPILQIRGYLLASVQSDMGDAMAERFQNDVLKSIDRTGAQGLVIDITALDIVDTYVARVLADTALMAKLMGTQTVVVGMSPEIAATLVQMQYPLEGVETALNIDDGIELLDLLVLPGR